MSQQMRDVYLQEMGIVQWRDRFAPATVDSVSLSDALLGCYVINAQQETIGAVILDQHPDPKQHTLLANILFAMDATAKQLTDQLSLSESDLKFILVFSDNMQPALQGYAEQNQCVLIASVSLSKLLQQPKLKAKLWNDLQELLPIL